MKDICNAGQVEHESNSKQTNLNKFVASSSYICKHVYLYMLPLKSGSFVFEHQYHKMEVTGNLAGNHLG